MWLPALLTSKVIVEMKFSGNPFINYKMLCKWKLSLALWYFFQAESHSKSSKNLLHLYFLRQGMVSRDQNTICSIYYLLWKPRNNFLFHTTVHAQIIKEQKMKSWLKFKFIFSTLVHDKHGHYFSYKTFIRNNHVTLSHSSLHQASRDVLGHVGEPPRIGLLETFCHFPNFVEYGRPWEWKWLIHFSMHIAHF